MNAYEELMNFIPPEEEVLGIVFGKFGWGGFSEPDPPPVPKELRGKVLTIEEAKPLMQGWTFETGYGGPDTYAVYAWIETHVIFVTQYDGATWLEAVPRNPTGGIMPKMPGG